MNVFKLISLLIISLFISNFTYRETRAESLEIEADILIISKNKNKSIFSGNVILTTDDIVIRAKQVVIYYSDLQKNNKSKTSNRYSIIDKIHCIDNVIISTNKEKITGDEGEYSAKDGIITIRGNVKLTQEKNILTGNEFRYNKLTGEGVLSSDKIQDGKIERPKALINWKDI